MLPVDDSGYGFDNIGDVLSVSPALLERYMSVGRMVSRLAVGDLDDQARARRSSRPRAHRPAAAATSASATTFRSIRAAALSVPVLFPAGCRIRHPRQDSPAANGADPPAVSKCGMPVKAGLRTVGVDLPAGIRQARNRGSCRHARGAASCAAGPWASPRRPRSDLRLDGARSKRFEVPENGGRAAGRQGH